MSAPALQLDHLTKRYGSTLAVDDVSLTINEGDVVGFLGPNGAGKSTTLRLALGLIRPSAGHASIFGAPAGSLAARQHCAYVPGDVTLWPQLTGGQAIELLQSLHGSFDAGYAQTLLERFELDPHVRVRAYSKGNRQKVALVAAFSTRAPLLLLDEPTSGLDPLMERAFRVCIAEAHERGQAVLLSSHILSEVEQLSTRVAMIRAGQLVRVADIDELRQHVGVSFDVVGDVTGIDKVAGVASVSVLGETTTVQVGGDIGPVLAFLASKTIVSLRTREASLEEIFLSYYDQPSA
jgi:ABC-2 type transport system ATP-binding protein